MIENLKINKIDSVVFKLIQNGIKNQAVMNLVKIIIVNQRKTHKALRQ